MTKATTGAMILVAGAAVLTALPRLTGNQAILNWAFLVLLYAALAQSWNILGGFAGQVNLGYAAFFGTGAILTRSLWLGGHTLPLALLLGTLGAAALGAAIAIPSLRLHGPYFAIGTLAVAEILRITVGNTLPNVSSLPVAALAVYDIVPRYYLALLLTGLATAAAWWLTRCRFGLGLEAVREDEGVAESIGIHAFRHKLIAFVISSTFAGLGGATFGYYHLSFYPSFAFSPLWTFDPLLITYLGGVGTVWGPLIGATVFLSLREALALRLGEMHLLVFGLLFIGIVIALPGGFMEAIRALQHLRPARRRVEADIA